MRLSDIVSMGIDYILVGIVALLFVGTVFSLWYFLWFKKKRVGEKLDKKRLLILSIFIIYGVVVLGVTMLSRGNYYGNNKIYPLFYSYKDAWNDFSKTEWRNIILNICMFVPLGIFIPLVSEKTKRFWIVYLLGAGITCCIECFQLVTKRGVFELDDLLKLNNLDNYKDINKLPAVLSTEQLHHSKEEYLRKNMIKYQL